MSVLSRIDTVLSSYDPDYTWSSDINWWPGDPLWPHPSNRLYVTYQSISGEVFDAGGSNTLRPMFQIVDDAKRTIVFKPAWCSDCAVGGDCSDTECWFCGKTLDKGFDPSSSIRIFRV